MRFQATFPGVWGEDARIDLELLKKTAAEVLESEGEVPPVAFLENVSGVVSIPVACSNNKEKHFFFHVFLPALIRATGTTRLGIVHEVWFYCEDSNAPPEEHVAPSQHPDREEAVSILILTAEDVRSVLMTIVRDNKGKPKAGEIYETNRADLNLLRECVKALKGVAKEIPR